MLHLLKPVHTKAIVCLILIICASILPEKLHAQPLSPDDDALDRLLDERDQLYERYEQYDQTNSSFWGTKSKSDLRNIINVLKNIIRKDSEIVQAIRMRQSKKEISYVDRSRYANERLAELEEEASRSNSKARQRLVEIRNLQEELQKQTGYRIKFHWAILIIIILSVALVLVVVKYLQLQRNLSKPEQMEASSSGQAP